MPPPRIRAGTLEELRPPTGDWTFVDLGFSTTRRSTGFLSVVNGDWSLPGKAITFGEATARLVRQVGEPGPPLHLVLEAPLSAFFDAQGNPVGREGERRGSQTRYWYAGLGCVVKVAALFLLEALARAERARELRVFEGFVSFKDKEIASNHVADVEALRRAVLAGVVMLPIPAAGETAGPVAPAQGSATRRDARPPDAALA